MYHKRAFRSVSVNLRFIHEFISSDRHFGLLNRHFASISGNIF